MDNDGFSDKKYLVLCVKNNSRLSVSFVKERCLSFFAKITLPLLMICCLLMHKSKRKPKNSFDIERTQIDSQMTFSNFSLFVYKNNKFAKLKRDTIEQIKKRNTSFDKISKPEYTLSKQNQKLIRCCSLSRYGRKKIRQNLANKTLIESKNLCFEGTRQSLFNRANFKIDKKDNIGNLTSQKYGNIKRKIEVPNNVFNLIKEKLKINNSMKKIIVGRDNNNGQFSIRIYIKKRNCT